MQIKIYLYKSCLFFSTYLCTIQGTVQYCKNDIKKLMLPVEKSRLKWVF